MADERWQIDFFTADDSSTPVQQYLSTLTDGEKQRFRTRLEMLAQRGTWIGRPVVDFLEENLWELRLENSPHNPRILFCAVIGRRFVLLHGFSKTGRSNNTIPESAKRIARERRAVEEKRLERQAQEQELHPPTPKKKR